MERSPVHRSGLWQPLFKEHRRGDGDKIDLEFTPIKNMFRPFTRWITVGVLATGIATAPSWSVLAEGEQGSVIRVDALEASNSVDVRGYARGTVPLFKTVGDRDSDQKRCMGYGSLAPDHVIEVPQNLSRLMLQIKTRSQDTTLVVAGPNNQLHCADDSLKGDKDAGIVLTNVKAGRYNVWVGAFEPGVDFRYTLSIQISLFNKSGERNIFKSPQSLIGYGFHL